MVVDRGCERVGAMGRGVRKGLRVFNVGGSYGQLATHAPVFQSIHVGKPRSS